MTKTGLVAVLAALAAIVIVIAVARGMRDSNFIIQAYSVTAIILAVYVWSLARRLRRAEQERTSRQGDEAA